MSWSFDEEKHEYRENGIIVPSVTQVLADNRLVPKYAIANNYARHRGTCIHKALELYNKGTLDVEALSPILLFAVKSWDRFLSDYQATIIQGSIEYTSVSEKYHFGFKLDVIVDIKGGNHKSLEGKRVLVDYKSGSINKIARIQTGGYEIGWNEKHPDQCITARMVFKPIDAERYIVDPYLDEQDKYDFLTLLGSTHIRRKYNG